MFNLLLGFPIIFWYNTKECGLLSKKKKKCLGQAWRVGSISYQRCTCLFQVQTKICSQVQVAAVARTFGVEDGASPSRTSWGWLSTQTLAPSRCALQEGIWGRPPKTQRKGPWHHTRHWARGSLAWVELSGSSKEPSACPMGCVWGKDLMAALYSVLQRPHCGHQSRVFCISQSLCPKNTL